VWGAALAAAVDLIAVAWSDRAVGIQMSSVRNIRLRMLFEE
jgi:hypothetical protein